jgi:hypothetical protein
MWLTMATVRWNSRSVWCARPLRTDTTSVSLLVLRATPFSEDLSQRNGNMLVGKAANVSLTKVSHISFIHISMLYELTSLNMKANDNFFHDTSEM